MFAWVPRTRTISGARSDPVVFEIGRERYTLVIGDTHLRDDDGQILIDDSSSRPLCRIDYNAKKLILSPECQGRFRSSACLTMYLAACKKEDALNADSFTDDITAISARVERFLHDAGIDDALVDRLEQLSPKRKPSIKHFAYLGTVAAFAIAFMAYFGFSKHATPPFSVARQFATPIQGKQLELIPKTGQVDFKSAVIISVPDPSRHRYVVFTSGFKIKTIEPDGTERTVASLGAPLSYMHISPEGHMLVAAAPDEKIYTVNLTGVDTGVDAVRAYSVGHRVTYALHTGANEVTWQGRDGLVRVLNLVSGESKVKSRLEQVVQAKNKLGLVAQVEAYGPRNRYLMIYSGAPQPLVEYRIRGGKDLAALDASKDAKRIVATFTDGSAVLFYPDNPQGYPYRSTPLPVRLGDSPNSVFVASDGNQAWICARELIFLDISNPAKAVISAPVVLEGVEQTLPWHGISYFGSTGLLTTSNTTGGYSWRLP